MERTYLFYDIETTGLNKAFDQVVQFAAIRTDQQLNELERYEYFIRLNPDVIPSPQAFITHRLSLTQLEQGMDEFQAMKIIHDLVNTPGTTSIGYNSLGFDDEFLRFSFYRNLLPPYTHQYSNQCSRMDLYPMTVMYFLFKNDLLKWPENNLKLENISQLNALGSGMAHNAMVDVAATLNLAKCFQQDVKTWEYLAGYFDKTIDLQRCHQVANDPMGIMIDGKFGANQQYQAAVIPLGLHNHYKNQFVWLRIDNENIMQASSEDFLNHTRTINKKIGEPAWVLPLKDRFRHNYLLENRQKIETTFSWLEKNASLVEKVKQHYCNYKYPLIPSLDVDASLYQAGFLSIQDQEVCRKIHLAAPENKGKFLTSLSQNHLKEILIRIMGRHFPNYLNHEQKELFQNHLDTLKFQGDGGGHDYRGQKRFTAENALQEITTLASQSLDEQQQTILHELKQYLKNKFNLVDDCP